MSVEWLLPSEPLDPLRVQWPAEERLYRVHRQRFLPRSFNPGLGQGRFHPFQSRSGRTVPTLYAADRIDGALCETVFRGVPSLGVSGASALRGIRRQALREWMLSTLAPRRALTLADLRGHGLRRLGLQRNQLLETEAEHYTKSAVWARALHACEPPLDGIVWISRQFDQASVMVLFGDRVKSTDLRQIEPSIGLYRGAGYREVLELAEVADLIVLH